MTKTEFEERLSKLFADNFGDAQFELREDHNGAVVIHTELADRFDPEKPKTYTVHLKLNLDLTVSEIEADSEEEAQVKAQAEVDFSLKHLNADINECQYDDFEVEAD